VTFLPFYERRPPGRYWNPPPPSCGAKIMVRRAVWVKHKPVELNVRLVCGLSRGHKSAMPHLWEEETG